MITSTMPVPTGRGFAVSGGVAQAVVNVIKKEDPTREVKVVSAQGLAECKKMMQLAAAGKYNGYLLEGMACPGGCIAGAGTLADPAPQRNDAEQVQGTGNDEDCCRYPVQGYPG